jgi:glycosyltransferase involved in cell wall biosynthesis
MSATFSIPYVLTEHFTGFQRDEIFPWRWPLIETGFQQASAIAAVSTPLKETIISHNLAKPSEVVVSPNLVHTSLFTLPPNGRPEPPPFQFVTIANLSPRKNISGLLDAFAEAFEKSSRVSLTIVGDGPERKTLEAQTRQLGIAPQISFLGSLGREAVRDALRNAHAFVLPSHQETFGVVVIEAMATGLPVVATRCGGPEDIVTEETGRLVPTTDPKALTAALQSMRAHWSAYDPTRIREYVLDRYGPEPFVQRTRSFYRRAGAA